MKPAYLAFLFSAMCAVAQAQDVGNSASVDASGPQHVATIRGNSGIAQLDDDKIELSQRVVYVNGVSYGPVPANCEIKFIVANGKKTLYVNGKPRTQPAK